MDQNDEKAYIYVFTYLLTNYKHFKFALKSIRRECDDSAIETEEFHFISVSLCLKFTNLKYL